MEQYHGIRDAVETVQEVLEKPDFIDGSRHTKDHYLYYKGYHSNAYYLVVVVDRDRKRIDTAYISNRIKKGKRVWTRS